MKLPHKIHSTHVFQVDKSLFPHVLVLRQHLQGFTVESSPLGFYEEFRDTDLSTSSRKRWAWNQSATFFQHFWFRSRESLFATYEPLHRQAPHLPAWPTSTVAHDVSHEMNGCWLPNSCFEKTNFRQLPVSCAWRPTTSPKSYPNGNEQRLFPLSYSTVCRLKGFSYCYPG